MSMDTDEIKRRIEELEQANMHMAARALQRELKFRSKVS